MGQYARRFQFSQQEYGSVRDRLGALDRLLREVRCPTTEQLLAVADKASSDLQHWYNFQGRAPSHCSVSGTCRPGVVHAILPYKMHARASAASHANL